MLRVLFVACSASMCAGAGEATSCAQDEACVDTFLLQLAAHRDNPYIDDFTESAMDHAVQDAAVAVGKGSDKVKVAIADIMTQLGVIMGQGMDSLESKVESVSNYTILKMEEVKKDAEAHNVESMEAQLNEFESQLSSSLTGFLEHWEAVHNVVHDFQGTVKGLDVAARTHADVGEFTKMVLANLRAAEESSLNAMSRLEGASGAVILGAGPGTKAIMDTVVDGALNAVQDALTDIGDMVKRLEDSFSAINQGFQAKILGLASDTATSGRLEALQARSAMVLKRLLGDVSTFFKGLVALRPDPNSARAKEGLGWK